VQIPVHVLIRPRSGNFTYSESTFAQMLRDISYCRQLGFEGIATGCLQPDNHLDREGMALLAEAAGEMHLTFHRAFDRIEGWKHALSQLESLGVDTILTSGRAPSAQKGLSFLEELVNSTRCSIMPGGGIRPSNLKDFLGKGFGAVHLSALPEVPEEAPSGMPLNAPGLLREGFPIVPDARLIREVVEQVRGNPS
jgi:copper homeostasis protein